MEKPSRPLPSFHHKNDGPPRKYHDFLDTKIDFIEEELIKGKSTRSIVEILGVTLTSFFRWKRDTVHNARVNDAMEFSSEQLVEKAEEVLLDQQSDGNMAEIQRRKELSQFYRWKAARKAPKVYGDSKNVDVTVKNDRPLTDDQFAVLLNAAVTGRIESEDTKTEEIDFEELNPGENDI